MLFQGRSRTQLAEVARIPDGMRVYAIGDIHGRADLLTALLAAIETDCQGDANTRVIFLGDYVDRGMQSRDVLERLRSGSQRWMCVMGNHEAMMLDALSDDGDLGLWLANGGFETLFSYGVDARSILRTRGEEEVREHAREAIPEAHVDFLRTLRMSVEIGDYFFCHAGVRPSVPLARQERVDLLWIREEFLQSNLWHSKRVVHGHTPVAEVEILPNRINVDTGAFLTNRLSCVALEGEEVRVLHT